MLSGIVELSTPVSELKRVLNAAIDVSKELDTVFSLDVACVVEDDNTIKAQKVLDEAGIWYRPNCKTNVGLGHL